jgi:hypothetical protein
MDRHHLLNQGILASLGLHILVSPLHRPVKGGIPGPVGALDTPDFALALLGGSARGLAADGACR